MVFKWKATDSTCPLGAVFLPPPWPCNIGDRKLKKNAFGHPASNAHVTCIPALHLTKMEHL